MARYTKMDGVLLGESAFGGGPALWVDAKQITNQIDDDTIEVRIGRKNITARKSDPRIHLRTRSSDWCELEAKHTTLLAELIELAASQHRVDDPKPPPAGADLARRKRFH
jgi:hypothetical protein